ncbi:MAG: PilZ domain-containing protein [Thermodesulfobacteriota bacterium]
MTAAETSESEDRRFLRIPIEDADIAGVKISGRAFEIINLGSRGVGIFLDQAETFAPDAEVKDIELTIHGQRCLVNGRIVHVSPKDSNYLCGIELLNLDQQTKELLQGLIDDHQASLFSMPPD